jgi:hypothetical protein
LLSRFATRTFVPTFSIIVLVIISAAVIATIIIIAVAGFPISIRD